MKRLLLLLLTPALLLLCVACTPKSPAATTGAPTPTTGTPAATQPKELSASDARALLETLANAPRTNVHLAVTTVTEGITLCAEYAVNATEVTYKVDKLSLFPTDGNLDNLPEGFVTTLSGVATLQNGSITAINGDAVTLPALETLKGAFAFPATALSNVAYTDGVLTATVTNSAAVLGTAGITGARITAAITADALSSLTVTYTTSDADVTMIYTF